MRWYTRKSKDMFPSKGISKQAESTFIDSLDGFRVLVKKLHIQMIAVLMSGITYLVFGKENTNVFLG